MLLKELKTLKGLNLLPGIGKLKLGRPSKRAPRAYSEIKKEVDDPESTTEEEITKIPYHQIGPYLVYDYKVLKKTLGSDENTSFHRPDDFGARFITELSKINNTPEERIAIFTNYIYNFLFYFKSKNYYYMVSFMKERDEHKRETYDITFKTNEGFIQTDDSVPEEILGAVASFAGWFATKKSKSIFKFSGIITGSDDVLERNRRISIYFRMLKLNNIKYIYIDHYNRGIKFSLSPIEGEELLTKDNIGGLSGINKGKKRATPVQIRKLNQVAQKKNPNIYFSEKDSMSLDNFNHWFRFYTEGGFEKQEEEKKQREKEEEERRNREHTDSLNDLDDDELEDRLKEAAYAYNSIVENHFEQEAYNDPFQYLESENTEQSDRAVALIELFGLDEEETKDLISETYNLRTNIELKLSQDIQDHDNIFVLSSGVAGGDYPIPREELDREMRQSEHEAIWDEYEQAIISLSNYKIDNEYYEVGFIEGFEYIELDELADYLFSDRKEDIIISKLNEENLPFFLEKRYIHIHSKLSENIEAVLEMIKKRPDFEYWRQFTIKEIKEMAEKYASQLELNFESLSESQQRVLYLIS